MKHQKAMNLASPSKSLNSPWIRPKTSTGVSFIDKEERKKLLGFRRDLSYSQRRLLWCRFNPAASLTSTSWLRSYACKTKSPACESATEIGFESPPPSILKLSLQVSIRSRLQASLCLHFKPQFAVSSLYMMPQRYDSMSVATYLSSLPILTRTRTVLVLAFVRWTEPKPKASYNRPRSKRSVAALLSKPWLKTRVSVFVDDLMLGFFYLFN